MKVRGFGLAGACLALELQDLGAEVRVMEDGRSGSTVVAAGLVNPVAGKNFAPGERWLRSWKLAEVFYGGLGKDLYHALPILRLWTDEKDREKFQRKKDLLGDFLLRVEGEGAWFGRGGWLDTRAFLQKARGRFQKNGGHFLPERGASAEGDVIVDCTGSAGLLSSRFREVAHRCARGEMIDFRLENFPEDHIRTGGGWMIPLGGGVYRAGATYDWRELQVGVTQAGRMRVLEMVEKLTGRQDVEVIEHRSGIRPIIRRSQPLVKKLQNGEWMFNGLGSKGVLHAPTVARNLARHLLRGEELDPWFT